MGFWDDLGAATEEFGSKYTTARRFRIQRESDAQRQALQRKEMAIREAELNSRLARQQEEKEVRAQIRVLANEYNRILATPTPGIWDFQNHTITDKAAQELIKISAQIAALDPQVGSTYGRYVDMIYRAPKPPAAKPNAVVEKFEGLKAIGYSEDDARRLAGGDKEKADPEEAPDVGDIAPFMKTLEEQGLNPLQIKNMPDAIIKDSFQSFVKQRRELEKTPRPEGLSFTTPSRPIQGTTVHYPTPKPAPAEEPIINEPQDTVEVDINDPRLRDSNFTESPFGIDVKAPATAEDEPASEDEVRQYVEEYKVGKKPFPTYKVARQYFKRALEKGFTTKKFYDTFHSKFISPMYPDTTK